MATWLCIDDEPVAPLAGEPTTDPARGECRFELAAVALPERRSLGGDVSLDDGTRRRAVRCLSCECRNALLRVRACLLDGEAPGPRENDDHLLVEGRAVAALPELRFGSGRRGPCVLPLHGAVWARLPLTRRSCPEPCLGCPVPEHIAAPLEPTAARLELLRLRQRRRVELDPFAAQPPGPESAGRLFARLRGVRRLRSSPDDPSVPGK